MNSIKSTGHLVGIAVAALVFLTLTFPATSQATDLGSPDYGYDYGYEETFYPDYSEDFYPDYEEDFYPDYEEDFYPDYEEDFYPDQTYSYDSGCSSCGGGFFGGSSFGGGFVTSGSSGRVGGGEVRVTNNNNNYNNNQNQNINNVNVHVGDNDNDDDKEEKKDKKKKKDRDDDRKVVYHPPVYHNPTPYVTLSQTPYTGLEMGPLGTALYWSFLVVWCLIAAYLIAVKQIHVKLAARLKTFLYGDDSVVSHPAYETEAPMVAVASAAVAPQMATLGEKLSKTDIAQVAQALIDVIEGKSTYSYETKVEAKAEDTTDPFILSQINRTR